MINFGQPPSLANIGLTKEILGAADENRTRVLSLGISNWCESSRMEEGGPLKPDPVGLVVPVSIFGVMEHVQISLSAQARAASVSDATLARALHHMRDSSKFFSFAPLVFIVGFVRRRFALAQRKSESSSTRSLSAATIRASRVAEPTITASRSWGG